MAYLRADAAYAILLGLEKLYGTGNLPAQMSKSDRTSQIILNMIEDCVDRHEEYNLDGDVKSKIQSLGKIVEDEAIKSVKIVYDDTQSVLGTLKMLVQVGEMLGAPGGCEGVRELVREYEDVAPDKLKPSEYGLVGEYGEKAIRIYLLHLAHRTVLHMNNQFGSLYTMIHIARHGRTSGIKCNPDKF